MQLILRSLKKQGSLNLFAALAKLNAQIICTSAMKVVSLLEVWSISCHFSDATTCFI